MQTQTLTITGMTSEHCAEAVRYALRALDGISDATVSLLRSEADVKFDESRIGVQQLQEALANAGYGSNAAKSAAGQGSCCGGCCS